MIRIAYRGTVRNNQEAVSRPARRDLGIVAGRAVRDERETFPQLFPQAELRDLLELDEDRQGFLICFALTDSAISPNF
jgi:hypothetical protein